MESGRLADGCKVCCGCCGWQWQAGPFSVEMQIALVPAGFAPFDGCIAFPTEPQARKKQIGRMRHAGEHLLHRIRVLHPADTSRLRATEHGAVARQQAAAVPL